MLNSKKTAVEVLPYNEKWPEMFSLESENIKVALGGNCIKVHHIGSTSIPRLFAKPIIDILVEVKNIQETDLSAKNMEALGYESKGEQGIAFRRFFQKSKGGKSYNVHVYQENDPEIDRYLKFRDWMRSHFDDAESYATLKQELAKKFPEDILGYCNGKDAFVANIDIKNGFDGWRMVQALTDREWSAVHHLRKAHSQKLVKDKDHIHFVFYKNADIAGYADLHLFKKNEAEIQMLVIEKRFQNLGLGSLFLNLCERWLKEKNIETLFVPSSPKTDRFYSNHGYGYPIDLEISHMRKSLH